MSLEIRVLGPLEIQVDGEPLHVDTRKASAIVALLALRRNRFRRTEGASTPSATGDVAPEAAPG